MNNEFTRESGVGIYMYSSGFDSATNKRITKKLEDMTNHLFDGGTLLRSDILIHLAEFPINKLFFIDLTCSVFLNRSSDLSNQKLDINSDLGNWLSNYIKCNKLSGGGGKKSRGKKSRGKKVKRTYKIGSTKRKYHLNR